MFLIVHSILLEEIIPIEYAKDDPCRHPKGDLMSFPNHNTNKLSLPTSTRCPPEANKSQTPTLGSTTSLPFPSFCLIFFWLNKSLILAFSNLNETFVRAWLTSFFLVSCPCLLLLSLNIQKLFSYATQFAVVTFVNNSIRWFSGSRCYL